MFVRPAARAVGALLVCVAGGCLSPLDGFAGTSRPPKPSVSPRVTAGDDAGRRTALPRDAAADGAGAPSLDDTASPDAYIRYALHFSPSVNAAYQRWRAAAERLPQVGSLPDPRLNVGFFLDEVETRTGAQRARVGVSQTLPWPGVLEGRADAAAREARAAWRAYEAERLAVTETVVEILHELAYLDSAARIARENLELLGSFEEVVRARYRVGSGSHPELVRVQVELGELEDRLDRLRAMRPAYAAELNAALNRPPDADVPALGALPGRVVAVGGVELAALARASNPLLRGLEERAAAERRLGEVARLEGLPDLTVGVDYIVTGEAVDGTIAESGDDPILLGFGVRLPLWREKYEAGVREAIARRLAVSRRRAGEANRISAAIQRAWFEHTDADRRVRLYETTLIPKSEESLRASLAGFRAGETGFLDLLDTERTLLEFALAAARARADRGQALARLNRLVGRRVPTDAADQHADDNSEEGTP